VMMCSPEYFRRKAAKQRHRELFGADRTYGEGAPSGTFLEAVVCPLVADLLPCKRPRRDTRRALRDAVLVWNFIFSRGCDSFPSLSLIPEFLP
jgi:hypothetical protein